MSDPSERRKYHRLYFSRNEVLTAEVALQTKPAEHLSATVLDLGEGGLGLSLPLHSKEFIAAGQKIVLYNLKGIEAFEMAQNVHAEMEIKWTRLMERSGILLFGCEFDLPAPEKLIYTIRAFMRAAQTE